MNIDKIAFGMSSTQKKVLKKFKYFLHFKVMAMANRHVLKKKVNKKQHKHKVTTDIKDKELTHNDFNEPILASDSRTKLLLTSNTLILSPQFQTARSQPSNLKVCA